MAVDRIQTKDKAATGEDPPGKRGAFIWHILAVAVAMRVLYLIDFRAHSVFWDAMMLDADIYDKWAQRIVAGDWLGGSEVFTLPPLYPYFLAILSKLFCPSYGTAL